MPEGVSLGDILSAALASKNGNLFFMVYSPSCGPTSKRHVSKLGAEMEAERLADKHPGCKFYVLRSYGYAESYAETKVYSKVSPMGAHNQW